MEEAKKEVKMEKQIDPKPIVIYFVIQILLPIFIGCILGANEKNMEDEIFSGKINFLSFLLINIIVFFVLLIIYWNNVKSEVKKIKKKTLIKVVIVSILIVTCNEIICRVFEYLNIPIDNQNQLVEYFKEQPVLVGIIVAIFAPIIEEFVFRYSIESIAKKELQFIVISSIIFGLMHGLGIATILYALIGMALAIIYIKTDKNIIYPIITHIMNNIVAIITMIFFV